MRKGGICFLVLLFLIFFEFADKAQCDLSSNDNYYFGHFRLYLAFAHAKSLQKTGLLNESIISFNRTLNLARRVGDSLIEAECLIALGILSWDKGEVGLSSRYFLNALNISPQKSSRNIDVFCKTAIDIHSLFNEAKGLRINKQFAQAKDKYLQAIYLARKIKSANHEVKCLRQMSTIYFYDYKLYEYYQANYEACELAKKYHILREEGYCSFNLALYFIKNGNCNKSFNLLSRSLSIALILGDLEDKVDCYYLIGFMFCELGNYDFSLRYLHKALSIAQDKRKKIELYNAIGITLKRYANNKDKEKYYDANCYYRKALNIAHQCNDMALEAIVLNNLGSSYIAQRKYKEALAYLCECFKKIAFVDSIDNRCIVLTNLGNAYYELKKYSHAAKYFNNVIEAHKIKGIPKLLWEPYYGLGKCYEKQNNIELAIIYYKKAALMLDKIDQNISLDFDRANFIVDKYRARESLNRLLYLKLSKNNNCQSLKTELLYYIDKSKAKGLFDKSSENIENECDSISCGTFINEECYAPIKIPGKIWSSPLVFHDNKTSRSSDNWFIGATYRYKNEELSSFSKLLMLIQNNNEKSAIFIYSVGEDLSILAIIMNGGIKYYQLPGRNEIEKSIRGYLKLISASSTSEFIGGKAASRILNEIFYPILEKEYRGVEKIIIIPDGLLFYLPFESLVLGNPDSESCTFVIEKYDVSYAPSLSFLYYLDQKSSGRAKKVNCLIVGDPDYDSLRMRDENQQLNIVMNKLEGQGFSLDPLPFTKEEAILIRNVIGPKNSMICLNKEASEDNIKKIDLKKYNIIHFACHGFIDEESPTRSALVLSYQRGSEQDGLLRVAEIYNLRLEADLVVLSACQTGRGLIARGEGILGLAKTFFYSGARSVISTLWNINDISTAIFMKNFYLFLYSGMTKSEALRFAKMKMIHSQYSHPFYWAAFILSGDYRSRFDWR